MRQDNELFRQLLSLHDSIEALKHGDGSLSGASSLCSLADIEEEDTISTPSTDLDRQSHLSAETDTLSVSGGAGGWAGAGGCRGCAAVVREVKWRNEMSMSARGDEGREEAAQNARPPLGQPPHGSRR